MRINFRSMITQLNGEAILGEGGLPFTLGTCAVNALLQPTNQPLPALEKVRRGRLAERAFTAEQEGIELELSPEDVVLIRDCIGAVFPPLIVTKAYRLLGDAADKVTNLKAVQP